MDDPGPGTRGEMGERPDLAAALARLEAADLVGDALDANPERTETVADGRGWGRGRDGARGLCYAGHGSDSNMLGFEPGRARVPAARDPPF